MEQLSSWKIMVAGAMGGVAFWIFTIQFDVVKSKIQTDSINRSERKYKTWMDCATKLYQVEGWRGFTRGFWPCIIRSAPANAACFLGYEQARRFMANQ